MKRCVVWVSVVLGVAFIGHAQAGNSIKIALAEGRTVEVPTSGPLYDPEAVALAKDIKKADKKLARLHKSLRRQVSRGRLDEDVAIATIDTLSELREMSAMELDLAIRKADSVAGLLDMSLIRQGREYIDEAMGLFGTSTARKNVPTRITTEPPAHVLHYMFVRDHQRKSQDWKSYNEGQLMHIGNYMFRVSFTGEDGEPRTYVEPVSILADPTERVILVP